MTVRGADVPVGCRYLVATAANPGAIAIVQLHGEAGAVLRALTGRGDWPVGVIRLARLGEIDRGLVGRLSGEYAELMPHGGPRVVQRLCQWLRARGVVGATAERVTEGAVYPEARDDLEARMLAALARAASPLAVDLLVQQPARWRAAEGGAIDEARSHCLNRLIDPPLVVLAGPPNVGKSTLSNALMGRSMSITSEMAGTTRDYTAGLIDLAGLVVRWHDTPGLRAAGDGIEREAIALAERLMRKADLLIAMTDREHDWPMLPRRADLRVLGKADAGIRSDADLAVSGTMGRGLEELARAVRELLVPARELSSVAPWRLGEVRDPR